jgi:hypothetical protein
MFAVKEEAKGLGSNALLPRLVAWILILFSGTWPHLKLLLLHSKLLLSTNMKRRKYVLNILSVLWRWNLADVFVVCVMDGVLNVSWTFNATDITNHAKIIVNLNKSYNIYSCILFNATYMFKNIKY